MARSVGIGIQSFSEVIQGNYFYIDKTAFIKEWWESGDSVTLIARPRRFGKTLNMSMLEHFFSVDYADSGDLFKGLSIWKEETYKQLQGSYPVISLSFANVKETTFENTKRKILRLITKIYSKYNFLLKSDLLSEDDKEYFQSVSVTMHESDATLCLYQLSDFLYRYYGKKVIILLDEYDTPMQEAYVNGFWEELVSFIRSMFNATFKTNPYMARGIMTGITGVSKESIFSDLNHLKVVTTTSNEYATAFGFTQEEVSAALKECGLENEKEKVKHWYDGFTFGSHTDIYNPWSVINFLDKGKYGAYWANSSSNTLVSSLIREADNELKMNMELLLKGETIWCPIDEQIVYNQLNDSEEAIWSLLLASGYLKVHSIEKLGDFEYEHMPEYEVGITNGEIKGMFYNMVRSWFRPIKRYYNGFVKALFRNDLEEMNIYMNHVALERFSYFDTGNSRMGEETERFYHGFVLGLLVDLDERYAVISNRESGYGRYDVVLEPRNPQDEAIIMEFKVHNPKKENTLEETVKTALQQIEDRKYEASLLAKGIPSERIRKYGFAFEGKNVLIG